MSHLPFVGCRMTTLAGGIDLKQRVIFITKIRTHRQHFWQCLLNNWTSWPTGNLDVAGTRRRIWFDFLFLIWIRTWSTKNCSKCSGQHEEQIQRTSLLDSSTSASCYSRCRGKTCLEHAGERFHSPPRKWRKNIFPPYNRTRNSSRFTTRNSLR